MNPKEATKVLESLLGLGIRLLLADRESFHEARDGYIVAKHLLETAGAREEEIFPVEQTY